MRVGGETAQGALRERLHVVHRDDDGQLGHLDLFLGRRVKTTGDEGARGGARRPGRAGVHAAPDGECAPAGRFADGARVDTG
ncbi:hypothetical protein GCM10018771_21020 [Streptomyces cellulosae]|nr:hypothetical protein GCM10018771_21020 [Streptomyces cellulosae]